MTKEELEKELENLKDFKVYVFEWDVYVKAEDYRKKAIENRELRKENKNLKLIQETNENQIKNDIKERDELREEIRKLRECNKSQSEVINNVFIPQQERLEEENKKLKEENEELKEYKSMYEWLCK